MVSPTTADDVATASVSAIAAPDESFFWVRFAQLTLKEKKYLRASCAMASVASVARWYSMCEKLQRMKEKDDSQRELGH